MQNLRNKLAAYTPNGEYEAVDRALMLYCIDNLADLLTRRNPVAHFTASSWIVNPARDRVLLIWHNIYRSWSWTGGHADGDADLLAVALREAKEETGAQSIQALSQDIFSLEAIHVPPHIKNGQPIATHIHLNATFLLQADEEDALAVKPDENSGVGWFSLDDAVSMSSEPEMKIIYEKLNQRLADW